MYSEPHELICDIFSFKFPPVSPISFPYVFQASQDPADIGFPESSARRADRPAVHPSPCVQTVLSLTRGNVGRPTEALGTP